MMGIALRCALLAGLLVAQAAGAATFTKIADVDSPGMGWTANVFYGRPAIDAGVVAFTAHDFASSSGVYTGSGGAIGTIADTTPFRSFSDPSISQGVVAFAETVGLDTTVYTGSG
ncbi:MAG TPA: hypothetical protein VNF72_12370, partial [Myxococcota bacterium]|nr:hypothetical protein [Myxococcota bacterium]